MRKLENQGGIPQTEKRTLPRYLEPLTRETCLGALAAMLRIVLPRDSAILSKEGSKKDKEAELPRNERTHTCGNLNFLKNFPRKGAD